MTDSKLLFDSFSVGTNPGIGGSSSLFGGSIGTDRTTGSSIINAINSSISNSGITSCGSSIVPTTTNISFNNAVVNNGSSSSSSTSTTLDNSIKKTSATTSSSSFNTSSITTPSNSSKPPQQNDNSNGNNIGPTASNSSSPNNLELETSSPTELWRSASSGAMASLHGLDLSKPPSLSSSLPLSEAESIKKESHCDDTNTDTTAGLDLSKPDLPSPGSTATGNGSYRRPSPFTNGVHSDPPTPQGGSHAPSRSISSGSGGGVDNGDEAEGSGSPPFGVDSILNDHRSSDAMTNGDSTAPLSLSTPLLGAQPDRPGYMKTSPKFPDPYSVKAFDGPSPPPLKYSLSNPPPLFDGLISKPPTSESHHKPPSSLQSSKYKDSYIAARLADNTFVKPLDTCYSKLLEGYGNNARNNNNNNNTSNNNNTGSKPDPHDSPFGAIPESYAKHIENIANGYKAESSSLCKDGLIFKGDPTLAPNSTSSLGSFPKREGGLTNGLSPSFGVPKSDPPSSSSSAHSPGSNSSLPSILNFSANHLRGMATGEGGLANYLSSYTMGGPLPGSLGGGGGSGGGDSRASGGGSSQSEGGLSRASPNNKLACRFCGKTFSQAGYIKAHERLHTGEKPFACSVCGKRFSDPSNWKKHERVHANNKKVPGSGGQLTGLDPSDSKVKHMFIKSISSLVTSSLQHRLAVRHHHHHDFGMSGPIMCKICGKMFSSQSSLSTHKRIHTGERPYRCRSCGKSFTQIGTLRTHERIHTGEKPYICKVCGRTFAQSGSFRMHERRHMTDSIQRCHVCYDTFSSWQDLQRHMATHPQVTQAILEFEEGNQGLMGRLNPDLADGGIGQLGHHDPDGPPGHSLLQGDHRSLGLAHHPRCPPPPLLPESLLLDSEAAAFHVQSRGLYPGPGQLPPFSSILPFRPHPGAPPAFPPAFPSAALNLLNSQSLPSHADLLTKHPIFGAMNMALAGPQHPHHPPPPPPPPHIHHPGHHQPQPSHLHPDHLQPHNNSNNNSSNGNNNHHHHPHHRNSPHPSHRDTPSGRVSHPDNGVDVVSTTSSGSRRGSNLGDGNDNGLGGSLGGSGSAMRTSSRSYTPEEARSDSDPMPGGKEDKEGSSTFCRSVSSDEGAMSPDEENGGGSHRNRADRGHQGRYHKSRKLGSNTGSDDDDMGGRMRRLSDNEDDDDHRPEDDDDTDVDDRYASEKSGYARGRRYSDEMERAKRDIERGRDRDRGEKISRNRSRSFERERERDRGRRDRKRSHSGTLKSSSGGALDYMEESEQLRESRGLLHERRDGSPRNHHRGSPKLKDDNGHGTNGDSNSTNNDDDFLDPNVGNGGSGGNGNSSSSSNNHTNSSSNGGGSEGDCGLLRPPTKSHIGRLNLNTRMIPSSSSRKQRHPMRRFSSAGSEQESPQSSTPSTTIGNHSNNLSHLPVSSTTVEATLERNDAELVTFLLKEGSVYKCVHCHMIFEDASLFLLHNGFHAHDEPFRCVVCHHICKDRVDFNCHLTSHIK